MKILWLIESSVWYSPPTPAGPALYSPVGVAIGFVMRKYSKSSVTLDGAFTKKNSRQAEINENEGMRGARGIQDGEISKFESVRR